VLALAILVALFALVAYLWANAPGTPALSISHDSKHLVQVASESAPEVDRLLALEQRFHRCDGCGRTFVLSFERRIPDTAGDTTVNEVWVKCARPSCQRLQPVLVPMASWNHKTAKWSGPDEPASARPSRRALQTALAREGKQPGRPTTG
jgi:hypothetical protein